MAPDRTILHLVKKKSQTPPPLKNYGVHTNKPQLRPWVMSLIIHLISLNFSIAYLKMKIQTNEMLKPPSV